MRTLNAFVLFALLFVACNVEQPVEQPDQAQTSSDMAEKICGLLMPPPVSCTGMANNEICDDNDPCTAGDHCEAGTCVSGTPGRLCVRCKSDADCCAGTGSISCDDSGNAWAPTGRCLTESGVCVMDSKGCLLGQTCYPGRGCK